MNQCSSALTRRLFVTGCLAMPPPLAAEAQSGTSLRRVGVLGSSTKENFAPNVVTFRDAMRALGWEEGRNLAVEERYADERYEQLPRRVAELIKLKVDVIFAMATPTIQAAKRATTTIPVVIETLGDALGTGLVPNLARPGGNVTGVSGFAPELSGKRLSLMRDLIPSVERIGLTANRTNASSVPLIRTSEDAARQLRVQLLVVDVPRPEALDTVFERLVQERCTALVLAADPMLFSLRRRIIDLAARHRLPAAYEYRAEYVVE